MKKKKKKEKLLIGRVEEVDFTELELFGVQAKIDTGAYTTALHCQDIYESRENGIKVLYFKPLDKDHPLYTEQEIRVQKYARKKIKNSFGQIETRFVISTKIKIGNKEVETDISLADRANMRYPVLLGRKLLSKGFLIDVNKQYIQKKLKEKMQKKNNKIN
ncbi:MAG: ATP-dependent zinc protease [Bacteroidia bacterium]